MLKLKTTIEGSERSFPLATQEVRIGRGGDNEIVLSDFSVSRRHAALRREPEGWFIYDLMSTNGVQLNQVAVKKAPVRSGDRLKVGIFELQLEGEDDAVRAISATKTTPAAPLPPVTPPASPMPPSPPIAAGASPIGNATIVRPLSDFSLDFGLASKDAEMRADKRKQLDQAYGSKIFGFLTKLAQMLIKADSVDDVLIRVMEICFEALPVDRGFMLLRDDDHGEIVCELARFKDRIELRPQSEVPVSKTMLETVMNQRIALLTYDALSDQRLAGGESIRIHQIRAAMCAPLWSGEKIIGVMQVDSPFHAGTFNEQDLDLLTALANYAAVAVERLRNAKKVEQERRLRSRLERYHSPAVIEEVLRGGASQEMEVQRTLKLTEATVLFGDLAGFTAFSERARPEEVAELLEGYFTHSVEAIFEAGGTLDKFIGDCVMAFFGAPMAQPDHAVRAVRAAIEIQQALREWNADRERRGLQVVKARIALNSGPMMVGDIGSNRRVDYTVLGNTVNVAARLEESVAPAGEIAIGAETFRLLDGAIPTEPLGEFALKGLQQKITAYRVLF
jgi:adenylate cyclase